MRNLLLHLGKLPPPVDQHVNYVLETDRRQTEDGELIGKQTFKGRTTIHQVQERTPKTRPKGVVELLSNIIPT